MRRNSFLLWALFVALLTLSVSAGNRAFATEKRLVLSDQLDHLPDPEGKESLASILAAPRERWQSVRGQIVNFGFSHAVHWFQLELPRCASPQQERIFEIAYPPLDDITVWEMVPQRAPLVHRMGDRRPFADRPIQHVNFALPVGCHDATVLLLRVQSTSAMQLPLVLWDKETFYAEAASALMPQFFYFGAMLIMALYNLFVFISVRKLSYLFYVLFTLSFATFQAGLSGIGFRYGWPNLPLINDFVVDKSLNLVAMFALGFAMQYMRARTRFPKLHRPIHIFWWSVVGYHVVSFALPYQIAIKITIVLIMLSISFGFLINIMCLWKRHREGYFYIVAWSMFLNAAAILAMNKLGLVPRNVLTENSVQFASLLEAMLLSFALADQMNILRRNLAASHKQLKATLDSIETIVEEKTEDIRSILTTVQQGIITVRGHELLIESDHSPYALQALKTHHLAGVPLKKAFLDKLELSEDQRLRIQSALQVCLADGLIAFELNASQFPSELRLKTEEGPLDLVVDWTPIMQAQGVIDRFLIVFRDVTAWKKLESFQASQSEMLRKLQQMMQAEPLLLRKFLMQSEKLLDVHLSISMHVDPATILKNIFIDIHTLKGESRSLGLLDLADACHRLEDGMSRMRSGQDEMSQLALQSMLMETQEVLHSYQRIYQERLKGLVSDSDVLVKMDQLEAWQKQLGSMARKYPDERVKLEGMLRDMNAILYITFDQFQSKLRRWCRRIAVDLGRPEPKLDIASEVQYLDSRVMESLDKIFIHLLQNALAHGIEAPEVRRMHGKLPQGSIAIRFERTETLIRMLIRDDGRGFDRARIQRKASLLGLTVGDLKLSPDRLKELVLTSGFSSLESVHSYAGRGVGLDAVQGVIKQLGGQLHIELFAEEIPGFIPFELRVDLPAHLFPATVIVDDRTSPARTA
ncbi:MAG TPA: 7TM diverse intracellular signaling domain-containing protein [Oligoflexus sp.]|uniref:7TM diverse intracellular signaling domain-containing protein n=1 Tax=Oligoflexus sp. TaxID=1971216 RepID=UPI002D39774C|nr:7TM diverse intracellular signaling domain-containing protein [Oligoflexus sp.]HYX33790.1 7TM diverse intracellular signaling domain-containing protein [Oligoflexus sp.]